MIRAISRENLKENFVLLGVNVSDAVLEKCVDLCETHGVEEEELVETWMAYSLSKLSGATPTLDNVRQMACACFKTEALPASRHQPVATSSPLVVYNAAASSAPTDDDIFSAYNTTPKAKGKSVSSGACTPDNARASSNVSRSPRAIFSPASFSPCVGNVSAKYLQRTNAGDVVCSYGDTQGLSWRLADNSRLRPAIQPLACSLLVPPDTTYMFQHVMDEVAVMNHVVHMLELHLVNKHSLGRTGYIATASPDRKWVVGRVCCDGSGRLNSSSVLLEGMEPLSSGMATPCDLHLLSKYSLFPGQVVAMEVTNHSGELLLVHAIHAEATLPLPAELPRLFSDDATLHGT